MKRTVSISAVLAVLVANLAMAEGAGSHAIGIVELPGIFGESDPDGPPGLVPPVQIEPVPVHSEPAHSAPVIATIFSTSTVKTMEFDYEAIGAVVYAISDGWVLIHAVNAGDGVMGWVSPLDRGQLHTLEDLIMSGLSYLNEWDGVLFEKPGASTGAKRIETPSKRQSVTAVASAEHEGALWFEVEVLSPGHCGETRSNVVEKGWVPAYKDDGTANVWFHSRGC